MSRKRKQSAKATAASMVMDTLKKNKALDAESALDVSIFKNLPFTSPTIGYTINNLMEEGVVQKTDDDRFYFDEMGYKALEVTFVKGYAKIFIIPIIIAIVLSILLYFFK